MRIWQHFLERSCCIDNENFVKLKNKKKVKKNMKKVKKYIDFNNIICYYK